MAKNDNKYLVLLLVVTAGLVLQTLASRPHRVRPAATAQEDFVETHNNFRSQVGVAPLTWNDTLAEYALEYANQRAAHGCDMKYSGGPYGENIAEGYQEIEAMEAVEIWASLKRDYHHENNTCSYPKGCGPYTQIVWRDTVRLGCAIVGCSNQWVLAVCSYDPPGNIPGQSPY